MSQMDGTRQKMLEDRIRHTQKQTGFYWTKPTFKNPPPNFSQILVSHTSNDVHHCYLKKLIKVFC